VQAARPGKQGRAAGCGAAYGRSRSGELRARVGAARKAQAVAGDGERRAGMLRRRGVINQLRMIPKKE
jgi:hypothetical protein